MHMVGWGGGLYPGETNCPFITLAYLCFKWAMQENIILACRKFLYQSKNRNNFENRPSLAKIK